MDSLAHVDWVVCRPALAKDTEQVMELCSHIWEGGDYIPLVWDEWMADPEGLLGVAELKGRVVAIAKLTKFRDEEWYMEGLRVHPDFQGKGIAAHVHNYVVETWNRIGSGTIRLATHSENIKVHRMCEQGGFRRIAEFIPYRASVLQEEANDFTRATIEEAQQVLCYLSDNPTHALSAGLINLRWVFADPQLKYVQEVINNKHAWWWRSGAGFISIWEDEEDGEHEPGIELIACGLDDIPGLLMDYRRLMGDMGYKSAGWVAPNHPEVIAWLEKTGFERTWDKSLYIYELRSKNV
jgi:GNAT superfamily N-acetyltransferase